MLAAQEDGAFTAPLYCVRCKQSGFVTWVKNRPSPWKPLTATSPVSTSGGFHLKTNIYMYANPDIVCGKCGAVHRDTVR